MQKFIIVFLSIIAAFYSYTIQSMFLQEYCKFPPLHYMADNFHNHLRKNMSDMSVKQIIKEYSEIVPIKNFESHERHGRCGDWAFQQIIKADSLQISTTDDWIDLFITKHRYFKQTKKPKPNDLALYVSNPIKFNIKHFAIVVGGTSLMSKWGTNPYILEHQPFHVPKAYGNYVYFFTLTKKYKKNRKNILLANIKKDINRSPSIITRFLYHQRVLLMLADGKKKDLLAFEKQVISDYQICTHLQRYLKTKNPFFIVRYLLEIAPWISVNIQTEQQETPLMLAAKRGDLEMVKLFVRYGANIYVNDKNGNNVTWQALDNKNYEVFNYLLLL
jgi:hypothetical protein